MDKQKRIDATIESINERIDSLVNRPGMMTGTDSYHLAEVMLTHFLCIRATLVGGDYDYRKYCNEHYSEIPGPVRCIASYLNKKWDKDPDGSASEFEGWKHESSKFVNWAMEEMSKVEEKIIAEAKG